MYIIENNFKTYFSKIYSYMALGLGISALTSILLLTVFKQWFISIIIANPGITLALLILEIGFVIWANKSMHENSKLAFPLYIIYTILNGITMTFLISRYTTGSVINALIVTTISFIILALIGRYTKKDLSIINRISIFVLVGMIVAIIVNMFLGSSLLTLLISITGVLMFAGLIAYDNQYIENLLKNNYTISEGLLLHCAFKLYLDFVNLFIYILRLLGKSSSK